MANTKKPSDMGVESKAKEEVGNETAKTDEKTVSEKEKAADKTISDALNDINKTVDSIAGVGNAEKRSVRKPDIDLKEEIAVRSVTFGGLGWISPKTNARYRWNNIGAVEYIPFDDLIAMNNTSQSFLTKPYIILQDERAVEYFRLAPVYEKVAVINDLENLFNSGDVFKVEQVLREIRSTGMRDVAISKIKELRETHKLNNIDIIRLIEKILCFDME